MILIVKSKYFHSILSRGALAHAQKSLYPNILQSFIEKHLHLFITKLPPVL